MLGSAKEMCSENSNPPVVPNYRASLRLPASNTIEGAVTRDPRSPDLAPELTQEEQHQVKVAAGKGIRFDEDPRTLSSAIIVEVTGTLSAFIR
jgi:hypothetical protein